MTDTLFPPLPPLPLVEPEPDLVWVASDYTDTVRSMERLKVEAQRKEWAKRRWTHRKLHDFPTKAEAWVFIVARAEEKVSDSRKQLKKDEARLRLCVKRAASC